MKKLTAAFLLSALAFIPFAQANAAPGSTAASELQRPEIAEQVKAWQGEEGIEVWILRYGPREENKALVQVVNIDHPWNRKIQIMDVARENKKKKYSVVLNGNRFVVLSMDGSNVGELYLPHEQQPWRISYSDLLSQYGNAQHFLSDYLAQQK